MIYYLLNEGSSLFIKKKKEKKKKEKPKKVGHTLHVQAI